MRKICNTGVKLLAAVCLLLYLLSGCAQTLPEEETTEQTVTVPVYEPVPPEFGIVLEAQDVSAEGMTVLCTRQGESWLGTVKTGMPDQYWLETWDGRQWTAVRSAFEVVENPSLRRHIAVGDQVVWKLDWQKRYGQLPEGSYRYVRKFWDLRRPGQQDWRYYSVSFEIAAAQ